MYRRHAVIVAVVLLAACASVPPPSAPLQLFVNYTSGDVWPRGVSARIYADGTLELGDGATQVRRRLPASEPRLARIREALEESLFREELHAASIPSPEWRSSGSWIRIERGETVALIKPPVAAAHLRNVLADVNALFGKAFGRRYEPIGLD